MEISNTNILIIAGMGRSGTSVITQWINKCGLPVGDELLGPAIGNVEGHFEDIDFLKIHEEILVENNLSSTGLISMETLLITPDQKDKISTLINNKNSVHQQWGWKEPRTCLFLKVYKELIPGCKYLIIVRDYKSVTASLLRRDYAYLEKEIKLRELTLSAALSGYFKRRRDKAAYYTLHSEKYLKVCIAYYQEIIKAIADLSKDNFIVVSPDYLKTADKQVFTHLTRTWNFNLSYVSFNAIFKEVLLHRKNNITKFIRDKTLLQQAEQLETIIKNYIMVN